MKRIYKKLLIVPLIICCTLYLILPVVAGLCTHGNLLGPKIYPRTLHSALYEIGWELSGSAEGGPRVPFDKAEFDNRLWFYITGNEKPGGQNIDHESE